MVAARYPDQITAFMADKIRQHEDPGTDRFYQHSSQIVPGEEEPLEILVREMADLLVDHFEDAGASGQLDQQDLDLDDPAFVHLLDSMADGHLIVIRLREVLAERGWTS